MAVFELESGSMEAISRRRIHSLHSSITSTGGSSVHALHGLVGRGRTPQGSSRTNVVINLFPFMEWLIQENQ
ncbi:uncharacterized protein PHALS_07512 [Plasmopara halstedii]|uniref:Uncharacterized protein n=1 Tax=Plasmopara halstedii TaxID=4781 RepID=A0A0P1B6B2_PLAHL|nr:uncharacterized protein PHALS_07512 [Plasmopara halstedii]CEG49766.1 hypothetical protein PHALS_07512 [Plasmopara halstedii]|eukprot:XP_024586135.1 hypothetical protein PHALS_07512 [Plasmopara halstedii]